MIIDTDRLVLRALSIEEATAIASEQRFGQPWAPDYPTPGDVRIAAFALAGNAAFPTDAMPWGLFVIVDKPSGTFIGGIGFKGAPNERGEVEIGYGVCDSVQGRGVATEAVFAVCDLAARRSIVVTAETDHDNVASQRVLVKNGFLTNDPEGALIHWRREIRGVP